MKFTIYCHTNRVNGKKYVGQTKRTMLIRWKDHVIVAKSDSSQRCRALYDAIREHGEEAFDHRVLEVVDTPAEADAAETKWIAQLGTLSPNGYNKDGGGGARHLHDADTIERMSTARARHWAKLSPQEKSERGKRSNALPESRAKIGAAKSAWWASKTPEERSAVVRKRVLSPEWKAKQAEVSRRTWAARRSMQQKVTAIKAAFVLRLQADGLSRAAVARKIGVKYVTVTGWLKRTFGERT